MNFLELCKEVRRESAAASDGPSTVSGQVGIYAKMVAWTKLSYRMIVDSHRDWAFLWNRVSAPIIAEKQEHTRAELGIADAKLIWMIRVLGGQPLRKITWEAYRSSREDRTDVGVPTEYAELPNGALVFYPWPSAGTQLKFEYQRIAPDLTVDGDVPLIPAEFHDAIVWQAVLLCATDQENPALQNRAAAIYNERYDLLNRDYRPKGPHT